MKRYLLFAILFLAAIHAASAQTRIMMLGDSLTLQGEGRQPLYDRLTAEGYDFVFVGSQGEDPLRHEGHGGFTIGPDQSKPGSLFDNVDRWVPAARPDIVFLLVGNNDFNGKVGVDPAGAPERLTALVEKIAGLAPDAVIIVSTGLKIAPVKDYAGALNRRIPGIVEGLKKKGLKVHLADLNAEVDLVAGAPPFNGPDSDYKDGTHFNAAGGKKVADVRYVHLTPFLQKRKN
jgi:lysophospholipase L1-like esterase